MNTIEEVALRMKLVQEYDRWKVALPWRLLPARLRPRVFSWWNRRA